MWMQIPTPARLCQSLDPLVLVLHSVHQFSRKSTQPALYFLSFGALSFSVINIKGLRSVDLTCVPIALVSMRTGTLDPFAFARRIPKTTFLALGDTFFRVTRLAAITASIDFAVVGIDVTSMQEGVSENMLSLPVRGTEC